MLNCSAMQSDTYQAGARVKAISKSSLFSSWLKLAIFAADKQSSAMHSILSVLFSWCQVVTNLKQDLNWKRR